MVELADPWSEAPMLRASDSRPSCQAWSGSTGWLLRSSSSAQWWSILSS